MVKQSRNIKMNKFDEYNQSEMVMIEKKKSFFYHAKLKWINKNT
jgi:hypothetical protein